MAKRLTIVVLNYETCTVLVYSVPEDTNIEDFLFKKENLKESQIYWMVGEHIPLYINNDYSEDL